MSAPIAWRPLSARQTGSPESVAAGERHDPRESPSRSRTLRLDLAVALGLTLLALVIRIPHLWEIPRFTDELQEILWAFAIYRGEILPLTAVDSYYGPLWSYLLAGVFTVYPGGDLALLPRALAMVLAAVTVGLTYLVGRDMVGRRAGLVAAALLATSGGHVIINSHTARSNSITPLLTTLAVWLLYRAARAGRGRLLAWCGLVSGLALQTHLSVIALAPGMALGLLLMRPRMLTDRWVLAAAALFLLGYANMIIFNVQNSFWSLVHARHLQEAYTDAGAEETSSYLTNFAALVQSLSRLLSGTIDTPTDFARFPYLGLALAGLVVAARRGNPLLLTTCLSAALVLPYFNPRYGPILSGRYLVPLLPFCYLGIALAIEWLGERLFSGRPFSERLGRRWAERRGVAVAAASVALVLFPFVPLARYYAEVLDDGRVNRPLFALADGVRDAYRPGDLVLLDEGLAQEALTAGGTDLKALRFLLEARAIPYDVAKLTPEALEPVLAGRAEVLVVMDARKPDAFGRRLGITPQGPRIESASGTGHRYAVYRIAPRAAANRA